MSAMASFIAIAPLIVQILACACYIMIEFEIPCTSDDFGPTVASFEQRIAGIFHVRLLFVEMPKWSNSRL